MKILSIIFVGLIATASLSHAVVIVHVLPEPLDIFNNETPGFVFTPFDVDGNGATDFSFAAFRTEAALRTERANRLVIIVDPPPNLGGPVASLGFGNVISHSSLAQNSRWTSSDIIGRYISPDELVASSIIQVFFSGHNTQFTERSAIGIEFEAEDGIHYGYFDISPAPYIAPRITLHGWAWMTVPGRAILAGRVPEPSTMIPVSVSTGAILLRRRRKCGRL